MDTQQTIRMIEWLDEERRKDKSVIATLQERLSQQQDVIDTLLRRLNGIESDQASLRGQVHPNGKDPDLIDQVRREMQQLIEGIETKRLNAEREAERRAELAREASSRPLREITEKISRIERQTTELPAMNVEKDRLSTTVASLQQRVEDLYKRLEEPDRRLAFLEEQRRTDSRRLSELESDLPEVRKSIESVKPKVQLIEDLSLRNERKVQEVQSGDRERREQIQQFIDQQTLLLQQRDQQIAEVLKRSTEFDEAMKRNMERFETWAEIYREMKRIVDDFERIGDRLERRIVEVAEMQRLSEDRFRQEWNDWRNEDTKRWKTFTLSTDEIWKTHDRDFEKFALRVSEVESLLPTLQDSLNRMWSLERERAQMYRDKYQALLLAHDTSGAAAISAPANNPSLLTGASAGASTAEANPRSTATMPALSNGTPKPGGSGQS
jgi:chromosome segregation ATPase